MTATELQKYIGTTGKFQANGFRFEVKVTDARCVRNRLELLIAPMAGEGESWVMASYIALDKAIEEPGA
jgi:hypothetical protein